MVFVVCIRINSNAAALLAPFGAGNAARPLSVKQMLLPLWRSVGCYIHCIIITMDVTNISHPPPAEVKGLSIFAHHFNIKANFFKGLITGIL